MTTLADIAQHVNEVLFETEVTCLNWVEPNFIYSPAWTSLLNKVPLPVTVLFPLVYVTVPVKVLDVELLICISSTIVCILSKSI